MDIAAWLRSLGLERYEAAFRDNEIDATVLPRLTAEDLKDLGVGSVGHRRKLLDAIAALHADASAEPDVFAVIDRTAKDAAERRQVTVMFSDLVSSTALAARMDPEDLGEIISAYQKCVAETVQRYDGFVAKYMGDGVLVYFGYPRAHEDDAERAVRAGLELVIAVAALKSRAPLQTRIGIATGIVVVGELIGSGEAQERAIVGETPNLAARLQGIAKANMIVICDGTRKLLGNLFELEDLGPSELKGITEPTRVWAALRASSAGSRFEAMHASGLTALVGREEESELLLRRWSKVKTGEGQVVLLSGESGIGKSRLTAGLLESLATEPHTRIRYFCSQHHGHSPLHPFIAHIERAARFEPGSSASAKLDKLKALLEPMARNVLRDVALIADLLSVPLDGRYPALAVSSQQKREMTLTALVDQLEGIAARSPILVVFEDVHWIDPTSLELLDRTIARIVDLPVLLLITLRPEFQPTWVGQPHVTMLSLSRLGRRDSAGIVGAIAKGKALPAAVVEQILAQTDGVPLFIEELTSTLLESGLLRETTDSYVLDGPLPPLAVPTTLQASLVARFDRLAPVKEVAQIGAAIGREFSYELIGVVAVLPAADLDGALERLTASGLVSRRGTPPMATYSFKHALVQDAAYSTLLRNRRRQLHASIATALVARFPMVAETLPEDVARHFTEAGLASEATDYWCRAGQLANARSANREAVSFFEQALHQLEALPETHERQEQGIDLRCDLCNALFALGKFERIFGFLNAAEGVAEVLDDRRRLGQLSVYLCRNHYMAGHPREALEFGERALAFAEKLGDVSLELTGSLYFGAACLHTGDYGRGEDLLVKVLQSLEGDRKRERFGLSGFPAVIAFGYLAWLLADRGKFGQAIAHGEAGISLAEALDHPYSLAFALWMLARVHIVRGNVDDAVRLHERGLTLSREWNLTLFSLHHTGSLGYAYALSGRASDGIPLLEDALSAVDTIEYGLPEVIFLRDLGETYVAADRLADALDVAGRVLTIARARGQRNYEAWALRLLGEIAVRRDPAENADAHFRDALAIGEALGMRPLVARCHLGLGLLSRRTGKPQDAQDHLSTAAMMCREMDMRFWLDQTEAQWRELQ